LSEKVDGQPERKIPKLGEGRELIPPEKYEQWRMTLDEAVRMGLEKNPIIRQNGQFLAPQNTLLDSPDNAPSIFDIAIQDNGVLFGQRGIPGSLSDYDPRFSGSLTTSSDRTIPNSQPLGGGIPSGSSIDDDTTRLQLRLDQPLATGGTVSLVHDWNYLESELPSRLFPNSYTGSLGAEFRQPIWAGAGSEFTAIAGPVSQRQRGFVSQVNQGILIAKLNNKISQFDFEGNVQNLVREVGELYWDLYQTYEEYGAEVAVRDLSKRTWEEVKAKLKSGSKGGSAAEEAQAAESFYDSQVRTESALSNIYQTELRFRRLIGLPPDDGLLIRPIDIPYDSEVDFDRLGHLMDAYMHRLELKRQKTNIESLRLQWVAARSL
ncbi:MAG: TolC family protein, partial [Planctomycetes bacterium]|nr:TolC family protein [Planctomycetota bacterium]